MRPRKFLGALGARQYCRYTARNRANACGASGCSSRQGLMAPEHQSRLAILTQGLAELGRIDGRNVQMDTRWATSNADLRWQATEPNIHLLQPNAARIAVMGFVSMDRCLVAADQPVGGPGVVDVNWRKGKGVNSCVGRRDRLFSNHHTELN